MSVRTDIIGALAAGPRSVSSLARELGLRRADAEDNLRHALRSAVAAGHRIVIVPAECRTCGFVFSDDRLHKPSRCPSCRGSRILEAQIRLDPPA